MCAPANTQNGIWRLYFPTFFPIWKTYKCPYNQNENTPTNVITLILMSQNLHIGKFECISNVLCYAEYEINIALLEIIVFLRTRKENAQQVYFISKCIRLQIEIVTLRFHHNSNFNNLKFLLDVYELIQYSVTRNLLTWTLLFLSKYTT